MQIDLWNLAPNRALGTVSPKALARDLSKCFLSKRLGGVKFPQIFPGVKKSNFSDVPWTFKTFNFLNRYKRMCIIFDGYEVIFIK